MQTLNLNSSKCHFTVVVGLRFTEVAVALVFLCNCLLNNCAVCAFDCAEVNHVTLQIDCVLVY